MHMGTYLASASTLMMAIIVPLFLFRVWRGVAEGGDEIGYAIGLTVFALFGAFTLIPLLWMMAAMEPL